MGMLAKSGCLAVAFLTSIISTSAEAQGTDFHQGSTYPKVIEHGKTMLIGYYYDTNPDCTSGGDFKVYTTSQPLGGRVTFQQAKGFPTFPLSNIRSKCNARKVSVTKVFYSARKDFIGEDDFGLQSVTSSGTPINFNMQISVR